MKRLFIMLLAGMLPLLATAQRQMRVRKDVPLKSIVMSDPAILADKKTNM